jgi:hypothetical protein
MDPLRGTETELVGSWVSIDGQTLADPVSRRIEALVADALVRCGSADGGWSTLYRDPRDGRYWELTYPSSERHGGGPPTLTCVAIEVARRKYKKIE